MTPDFSSRPTTRGPLQRRFELDALRGLMLVWITLTHLPTNVSRYVNQPFGYFAASEGFILLSALFTGLIYFRIVEREGLGPMCRKLWMRAGRLYCYHLSLLVLAFLIEAPIAARSDRPAVHNLLDFYFAAGRTRASLDAALLLYRPPLLDILPLYIIFFALTPFAMILAGRFGWKYVLTGGFLFWLFAQFGFRHLAHEWMSHAFGLQIPLNQMGAFDLWAWQFWWIIGLWLGVRWAKGNLDVDAWAKRVTVPAVIIVSVFLVLRYGEQAGLVVFGRFGFLLNKWEFGFGRMVDFAAVAALAIRFQSILNPLAIRPLVMLGQASLEVFCVQLFCVFFALTAVGSKSVLSGGEAAVSILVSLLALFLTGKFMANQRTDKTALLPKVQSLPLAQYDRKPALLRAV
jgi:hypothetical protein